MRSGGILAMALLVAVLSGSETAVSGAPSAINYGGAVFPGGFNNNPMSSVEVIDLDPLPDLPITLDGTSITPIGSVLYLCGGYNGISESSECYALDMNSSEPQWTSNFSLPTEMAFHTAVPVGTQIWIIYRDTTYQYNTETGRYVTDTTPFSVSMYHCSVTNGGHVYVIGAGEHSNEIWVNVFEGYALDWRMVGILPIQTVSSGCVFLDDKIYITGGIVSGDIVEVFDTYSKNLQFLPSLNTARYKHGAFVYNGKPAVIGGRHEENATYLDDIEWFDTDKQRWVVEEHVLEQPRCDFPVGQIIS